MKGRCLRVLLVGYLPPVSKHSIAAVPVQRFLCGGTEYATIISSARARNSLRTRFNPARGVNKSPVYVRAKFRIVNGVPPVFFTAAPTAPGLTDVNVQAPGKNQSGITRGIALPLLVCTNPSSTRLPPLSILTSRSTGTGCRNPAGG